MKPRLPVVRWFCALIAPFAAPAFVAAQHAADPPPQPALSEPGATATSGLFRLSLDSTSVIPAVFNILQDQSHDHAHAPGHSHADEMQHLQPGLGANLLDGWLDPWQHSDYSRTGTPFVHLFLSEPAYLDRGVHIDFAFATGDEGEEYEAEVELEYAFTRRIGLVVEAPYLYIDPDQGPSENGIGDIAVAPRFLLLDYDRLLLSANLEFEFPTGDEDRELGSGETVFGPSLSAWLDLGHDLTAQGNIGIEHGFSSDSDSFVWGTALAYSLNLKDAQIVSGDGAVRSHFPVGLLSVIAELRGEHPLDGPNEGAGTAMAVLGCSYTFAPLLDLRAGVTFPAWNPREFDVGGIFGIIYHF